MIEPVPRPERASRFAAAVWSAGSEMRLYFNGVVQGVPSFWTDWSAWTFGNQFNGRLRRYAVAGRARDM